MRKEELPGYVLFLTGFLIKFFHAPFHAYLMMAGILWLLVAYVVFMVFRKLPDHQLLMGFATAAWMMFLLFIVKYYPYPLVWLSLAIVLSAAAVFYARKARAIPVAKVSVLATLVAISAVMFALPTDVRYYALNIKFNHMLEEDSRTWDRYSWFLYRNGKCDEAKAASDKALDIATRNQHTELLDLIKEHNQKIAKQSWLHF